MISQLVVLSSLKMSAILLILWRYIELRTFGDDVLEYFSVILPLVMRNRGVYNRPEFWQGAMVGLHVSGQSYSKISKANVRTPDKLSNLRLHHYQFQRQYQAGNLIAS